MDRPPNYNQLAEHSFMWDRLIATIRGTTKTVDIVPLEENGQINRQLSTSVELVSLYQGARFIEACYWILKALESQD